MILIGNKMNVFKLFFILTISMLALTGCLRSQATIVKEKQANYIGQPIETLVMLFGAPSASGEINGNEFFTWTNSSNLNISVPVYNNARTSGTISGSGGSNRNFTGSTRYTTYNNTSHQLNCTLTAISKAGKIIDITAKGQNGACSKYARAL
jgi:hypothetical protein|tara:strand:+ start:205 stop:660 length:456 start_codon:yes stop_codon:yes gene_type:complete